jgi:CxxC motif-containing protein
MDIEKRRFTCVICPIGCDIDVEILDSDEVPMKGNKCKKGTEFVLQELEEPKRILTTTIHIEGAKWAMLPVRTDGPIPKRFLFKVIEELANIELQAPVNISDVIVRDIAGTGANIVATRSMKKE